MSISPTVLSWLLLPLALMHASLSVFVGTHMSAIEAWAFYAGGFAVVFLTCVLVLVHLGERIRYCALDKAALAIALVSIVAFIGVGLEVIEQQKRPNKSRQPTPVERQACIRTPLARRGYALCSDCI